MIAGLLLLSAATGAAALLAAADAALITETPAEGEEPPAARAARDHAHRSLSLARLVSLLLAGAAVWVVVSEFDSHNTRVAFGISLALIVVALVEGVARSIGDSLGSEALRPLRPIERMLRLPVVPVVILGARIDALLERMLPPTTMRARTARRRQSSSARSCLLTRKSPARSASCSMAFSRSAIRRSAK